MAFSKVSVEGVISFHGEDRGTVRTAGEYSVINFSVAVQQRKREGDKWVNGDTLWKRCEAWGKLAENVAASFKKGDLVLLYGEERADSFEKDGETVVRDKVRVDSIGPAVRWDPAESHREQRSGGGSRESYSGGSRSSSNNSQNRNSSQSRGRSASSEQANRNFDNLDDLDFQSEFSSSGGGEEPPF